MGSRVPTSEQPTGGALTSQHKLNLNKKIQIPFNYSKFFFCFLLLFIFGNFFFFFFGLVSVLELLKLLGNLSEISAVLFNRDRNKWVSIAVASQLDKKKKKKKGQNVILLKKKKKKKKKS